MKRINIDLSALTGYSADILNGPSHEMMASALIKKTPLIFPDTEGNEHLIIIKALLEDDDMLMFFGTIHKENDLNIDVLGTMRNDKNGWGYFKQFKN